MFAEITGAAALAVAIYSAITSTRTSRQQVALQERMLSVEHARERDRRASEAQANLRADILPAGSGSYKLRIRNDGPGNARAIAILVDGTPLEKSDRIMLNNDLIKSLGAGAQVKYHVNAFMGMKLLFHVRLEWVDDYDDSRSWESELKI